MFDLFILRVLIRLYDQLDNNTNNARLQSLALYKLLVDYIDGISIYKTFYLLFILVCFLCFVYEISVHLAILKLVMFSFSHSYSIFALSYKSFILKLYNIGNKWKSLLPELLKLFTRCRSLDCFILVFLLWLHILSYRTIWVYIISD